MGCVQVKCILVPRCRGLYPGNMHYKTSNTTSTFREGCGLTDIPVRRFGDSTIPCDYPRQCRLLRRLLKLSLIRLLRLLLLNWRWIFYDFFRIGFFVFVGINVKIIIWIDIGAIRNWFPKSASLLLGDVDRSRPSVSHGRRRLSHEVSLWRSIGERDSLLLSAPSSSGGVQ